MTAGPDHLHDGHQDGDGPAATAPVVPRVLLFYDYT
jgi:hypothetical protein